MSAAGDEGLLRAEHLDAGYGGVQVLWDVSLEVRRGEVVALIGPNGAGKSTFLRVASGLLRAWRGTVTFDGREITRRAPEEIVCLGIAHVPQGRRLFPDLTLAENLLIGAYARADRAQVAGDLDRVLTLFPVLRDRLTLPAIQLSGGEQQMAALGRALMARPRLLLIDEPSLGLAPIVVQALMDVIGDLRRAGTSVLLVEQDVGVALANADRGYVLETGRIVLNDRADALLQHADIRTAYLGLAAGDVGRSGSQGR
jgi:branched-chain amino acid transport system ATP-binding protein